MNSSATDPLACKKIDAAVWEFMLHRRKIPSVYAKMLLSSMNVGENDANLRKLILLLDLREDVINGTVEERTLEKLESIEKLLSEESCGILDSLKSAYCWVAVDCTVRYMFSMDVKKANYLDAVERIWAERIGRLKERKSPLVTRALVTWEHDLKNAVFSPDLCKKIRETNVRYNALSWLRESVSEQFALLESPSLERGVERIFRVKRGKMNRKEILGGTWNGERPSGRDDDGVIHLDDDDDVMCDMGNNEELLDNEAVVHQEHQQMGDKERVDADKSMNDAVGEELKDCLLEMYDLVSNPVLRASKANGLKNASNPSNTDPSTPQRVQGSNSNVQENFNDNPCETEGTSSGWVRPHLSTPRSLNVSPLGRGQSPQPRKAPRKEKRSWTIEEEQALREGVLKYGKSWKTIKNAYPDVLAQRTEVNCKDKWRNLVGQQK